MRLQRHGSKKRPFYFIVVADGRTPRDGKFIQKIGTYNPLTVPATIQLDRQVALEWLNKGAQPTDTVHRILSFKGVLYLKHLLRGVKLGLFDEATAMAKRGYDEAPIRNKIAANTQGGKSADRAKALADKQTYGQKGVDPKARQNLARKQMSTHRQTTSSNPGLHGYGHQSNDPKVKAKQQQEELKEEKQL